MGQSTHEVRLANWKAVIEQCQTRPKGQTAKQWPDANGISSKQYYCWLRKVQSDVYKQVSAALIPSEGTKLPAVSFAEIPAKDVLPTNEPSAVVIKTKKSKVDVTGETIDIGKEQYMAQLVIDGLNKEKRYGITVEYFGIGMDELELSAGALEVLRKNQITRISELLDYLDTGKTIDDISGMSDDIAEEIVDGLEKLGFVET